MGGPRKSLRVRKSLHTKLTLEMKLLSFFSAILCFVHGQTYEGFINVTTIISDIDAIVTSSVALYEIIPNVIPNVQDALANADQDADGVVSDTESISQIDSVQGLVVQAIHLIADQIADLIEAASDLFVRSCYTFPALFESIEFSSGINFCDDVGAAVVTMIDGINADIKQVTDNIPIAFAIAQFIAN